MKITRISFITIMMAAMASIAADTFNITNYPVVHAMREEFNNFHPEGIGPGDGYGRNKRFWASKTEEEKDAYLAGLLKIAQDGYPQNVPITSPSIWFHGFFDSDKIHALDNALAEAGTMRRTHNLLWSLTDNVCTYYTMPRVQDNWYNSTNVPAIDKEPVRVYYTVYHRYPSLKDIPVDARINLAVFEMSRGTIIADGSYVKGIVKMLPVYLKRKFREQGKSFFVVKSTGENPVQNAVDEFIAAFNAPRAAGLKELVAKWSPNYEWIDIPDYWLTDEQVNELKDKVYYGEIEFTQGIKAKLMNNLGLVEYNKFVEWYNGGSKQ